MSYVECMECGDRLKYVAPAHLKKHGLTSEQYKQRYPKAPMASDDVRKKHSEFKKGMRLNRECRNCGKPFTTGDTKAYWCPECQRVRSFLKRREASRRYERRKRNSAISYGVGTFNEGYLKIVKGRVRGAMLLKANISINRYGFGRMQPHSHAQPRMKSCLVIYLVIICQRKRFCEECGSELTVARQNEQYTIPAEICCKNCGLVYRESRGYTRSEHPRGKIWLPRTVRHDPTVKETFGTAKNWGRR